MNSNFDMATPISNLQNNQVNVNNLVSSVESNIDNVIPSNNMLPTTTYQPTMVQQPVAQQLRNGCLDQLAALSYHFGQRDDLLNASETPSTSAA